MDKLDVFGLNKKKPLPGVREPVFPNGVPGVTQGIPPEYMKGYQPPPDTAQTPDEGLNPATADNAQGTPANAGKLEAEKKTASVEPVEKPKPKAKPKPRPKPQTASRPAQVKVSPAPKGQTASQSPQNSPWPAQQQQQQSQSTWPSQQQPQQPQQAQSPWPAPAQNTTAEPWPAAPPPGTFTR